MNAFAKLAEEHGRPKNQILNIAVQDANHKANPKGLLQNARVVLKR